MSGGGGGGSIWKWVLGAGVVLVGVAFSLHSAHVGSVWLIAGLHAVGGLAVVFGSCEAMIKAVEGIAARAKMNEFVAGTMAGLAANIPELVMLGFILVAQPRIGIIVTVLTLHVGVAAFGIYSGLLPRDKHGRARLPEPLVKLSTDLYACAGAVFFVLGTIMALMALWGGGVNGETQYLTVTDLYVLGATLIAVEVVAIVRLVKRFSSAENEETPEVDKKPAREAVAHDEEPMSVKTIVLYGLLGIVTSVIGGHAVGDFADVLVSSLSAAGYSEMVGALALSVFAAAGAFVMIATAHAKGMHEIALANASGAVTQVPFVVLPIALIMLAIFGQTGMIEMAPGGGVLPIDLETTSVFLLAFPSMLILWKAIQDDGWINWVETATMIAIFGLTIYFLAAHG